MLQVYVLESNIFGTVIKHDEDQAELRINLSDYNIRLVWLELYIYTVAMEFET